MISALTPINIKYSSERIKLGIKRKVLIVNNIEGRKYYKILKKQGLVKIKFLPKEIQNPQTIWVYNDRVAIVLVSEEHPIIFLIENYLILLFLFK